MLVGKDNIKIIKTGEDNKEEWNIAFCPREGHDKIKCEIKWRTKSGYSNPYSKLCTCFGGRGDGPAKVMAAYWNAP